MTKNKRFKNVEKKLDWGTIQYFTYNDKKLTDDEIEDLVNLLLEKNKELKQELLIYREVASCSNCKYHNYDWFDDGDEFEVCDKGNNEQQIDYHICKDWEEL